MLLSLESGLLGTSCLSQALEKKIGDTAVENLKVESTDGDEIPVSLNQVFPDLAELG